MLIQKHAKDTKESVDKGRHETMSRAVLFLFSRKWESIVAKTIRGKVDRELYKGCIKLTTHETIDLSKLH